MEVRIYTYINWTVLYFDCHLLILLLLFWANLLSIMDATIKVIQSVLSTLSLNYIINISLNKIELFNIVPKSLTQLIEELIHKAI